MEEVAALKNKISFAVVHQAVAVFTALVAATVFLGWLFNIDRLIRLVPGWSGMNPLTATLFLCVSASLICLHRKYVSLANSILVAIFFVAICRIGAIYTVLPFSVDLLFFKNQILSALSPSRMSLFTSISFLLLSVSLFANQSIFFRKIKIDVAIAGAGVLFALTALLGYLLRNAHILDFPLFFSAALHTVILFFVNFSFVFFWLSNKDYDFTLKEQLIIVFFLFVSLFLTVLSWGIVGRSVNKQMEARFDEDVSLITDLIEERIIVYTNTLYDGLGLFAASNSVDRNKWHKYVEAVNIHDHYPDIQSFGFLKIVPHSELQSYIESVRNEGFENFSVFPNTDSNEHVVAHFVEPFTGKNVKLFGYDFFSESARTLAIEAARDTGKPSITSKIVLVSEDRGSTQPGFVFFLPVYKDDSPTVSLVEKRSNVTGYIYQNFRVNDFIKNALGNTNIDNIDFHLYDGSVISEENEIFDHDSGEYKRDVKLGFKPLFKKTVTLPIANRVWTIEYGSTRSFVPDIIDRILSISIFLAGISISILVYAIFFSFASAKRKAVAYANEVTRSLQESKKEIEMKNVEMSRQLAELDKANKLMVGRELKMIELKKELENLKKQV